MQATVSKALHIIAALSQCTSPEEIIVRAALEMEKTISGTRAQIAVLVCEPKHGEKVRASHGGSEHVLWGVDTERKKKFVVSGSRPGLRACLATHEIKVRKVPNLVSAADNAEYSDDDENENNGRSSSAVIYIPFLATKETSMVEVA